jgi:hypothetical protein
VLSLLRSTRTHRQEETAVSDIITIDQIKKELDSRAWTLRFRLAFAEEQMSPSDWLFSQLEAPAPVAASEAAVAAPAAPCDREMAEPDLIEEILRLGSEPALYRTLGPRHQSCVVSLTNGQYQQPDSPRMSDRAYRFHMAVLKNLRTAEGLDGRRR